MKTIRILLLFFISFTSYAAENAFQHYVNEKNARFSPKIILSNAISPYKNYCDGYGNPGASGDGYINVIKLEVGIVKKNLDPVLDAIVSFDRAETTGAYIGQINKITASSFNGPNGLIWGYDLAKEPQLMRKPLFKIKQQKRNIPVYSIDPLLDAGIKLFGTKNNRNFEIMPGALVRSVFKKCTAEGPTYVWSALALSIVNNRMNHANLFMEDVGSMNCSSMNECRKILKDRLKKIALSAVRVGDNSHVNFEKIFVGYKLKYVPQGYVGTAITAAPYITLAQNALSNNPNTIINMTIDKWVTLHKKA